MLSPIPKYPFGLGFTIHEYRINEYHFFFNPFPFLIQNFLF